MSMLLCHMQHAHQRDGQWSESKRSAVPKVRAGKSDTPKSPSRNICDDNHSRLITALSVRVVLLETRQEAGSRVSVGDLRIEGLAGKGSLSDRESRVAERRGGGEKSRSIVHVQEKGG